MVGDFVFQLIEEDHAWRKKKRSAKKLGKKDMKKTKGGILIGLNQPTLKIDGIGKLQV